MVNSNNNHVPFWQRWKYRLLLFLTVFGPATITAMADNDAAGVASYSIAGARLGYPILFVLFWITLLEAVTQEMGIRLALVSRKGLGDLIRERFGLRISLFVFSCLLVANMGTIITNLAAVKVTSAMLNIPDFAVLGFILLLVIFFIIRGTYKSTEKLMLTASLFYLAYIFSAFRAKPNWGSALTNMLVPYSMELTKDYLINYLIIGMGVLGTTVTPWALFFISSFAFDKKIETFKLKYSQLETYWGAFLSNFFSFFMVVATAATLYVNKIPLISGEQAALAIRPFAGNLASMLFALGILNAGFIGMVIVALSTTYAFSEFFGFSGSLDESFNKSKQFYILFLAQLIVATFIIFIPGISLFKLAITTQALNAMLLPLMIFFLIKLTNNQEILGSHTNNKFQEYFSIAATFIIIFASLATLFFTIVKI